MTEPGGPRESSGNADKPLLSICVPTYNRAGFLKVMLEALLPQTANAGSLVEVIVSDNASADPTPAVVEQSRRLGPVSYTRNPVNIGPILNLIKGPLSLARGKYVWVLGDHNLLTPGALPVIIDALQSHPGLGVFYVNFRCATYPGHWPESAVAGYGGSYSYLGNESTRDREVARWSELVRGGPSSLCTQIYAHIVQREVWVDYWKHRQLGDPFTSGITTYPHTFMLADRVFNHPAWYIGNPVLTVFNGAQSWGAVDVRARVFLRGLPELIDLFARRGLPASQLRDARGYASYMAYVTGMDLFAGSGPGPAMRALTLLGSNGITRHRYLVPQLWRAFVDSEGSGLAKGLAMFQRRIRAAAHYSFYACRPARWARLRLKG